MSIQAMVWVMEQARARLGERLVLLAIANHADARGRNAEPSLDRIASEAGLSRRQVQRIIHRLEESGELVIERGGAGRGDTHSYVIPMTSTESDGRHGGGEKGDILSPITKKRVTSMTEKGDILSPISDKKGDIGVPSPAPSPSPPRPPSSPAPPLSGEPKITPPLKGSPPQTNGKRRCRLPEGCPSERGRVRAQRYWRERGVAHLVDIDAETDAFRAYHEAHGTLMVDWEAAWRTWYVRASRWVAERAAKAGGRLKPVAPGGITRHEWAEAVAAWKLDTGRWHPGYGPPPDSPDCRAPRDIVRRILEGDVA